jgi:hypothetical protein
MASTSIPVSGGLRSSSAELLIRHGGPDHFAPDVHSVIPGAPRRSKGEPGIQQLDSGFSMIGLRLMISPRK